MKPCLFLALWVPLVAGPAGAECTQPAFTTSDPNGGWSDGGYYVHNNMWNRDAGPGPETLYACSYKDWYVVSTQTNSAGAVKTYPNVHKDYGKVPIASFNHLRSTFAATGPGTGIYNVAFDIWLNGVAASGSSEVMIWTENFRQVPAGRKMETVTLGGRDFEAWKTASNAYIALVPLVALPAGTLDLLEILEWLESKGWIPSGSTLGQICYGVEIVSTEGVPAKFTFTDFSIQTGPPGSSVRGNRSPVAGSVSRGGDRVYSLSGRRIEGALAGPIPGRRARP